MPGVLGGVLSTRPIHNMRLSNNSLETIQLQEELELFSQHAILDVQHRKSSPGSCSVDKTILEPVPLSRASSSYGSAGAANRILNCWRSLCPGNAPCRPEALSTCALFLR